MIQRVRGLEREIERKRGRDRETERQRERREKKGTRRERERRDIGESSQTRRLNFFVVLFKNQERLTRAGRDVVRAGLFVSVYKMWLKLS